MKNNIYGATIIKSINSNWNAGMDGNPKNLSADGTILGSSNCQKYSIKNIFDMMDKVILGKSRSKIVEVEDKKTKEVSEKIVALDLGDTLEYLFGKDMDNKKDYITSIVNTCEDVRQFGITCAEKGINFDMTGVVQFKESVNLYEDTVVEEQNILSPYRNSNEKSESNEATTMGTKIFTDEAHYCYGFSIIPKQMENFKKTYGLEDVKDYSEDDYNLLKEAMLINATMLNTCSKSGCDNELSLFIKFKEGSLLTVPNLTQMVEIKKENNRIKIDITKVARLLNSDRYKNNIENIELYYDSFNCDIIGNIEESEVKDIFTREVV